MSEAGAGSSVKPLSDEDIAGMREIAGMGGLVGVGGKLLTQLLDDRDAVRSAALDLLRRLDKMGGTVTEGHSRKCAVWSGGTCGCAIAKHITKLQEAVGYGA